MEARLTMTLLVQAAEVVYAHGGNQIFTNVSFEVRAGDRLALIGENGAGKSTLFRLMARDLHPHAGTVTALEARVGDQVTRGQLLAVVEPNPYSPPAGGTPAS